VDIVVSRDGRHLYVASTALTDRRTGGIAVLARAPRSGLLRQLTGAAGCLSRAARAGCRRDPLIRTTVSAIVTRDGRSLIVSVGGPPPPNGPNSTRGIAFLQRNPRTGELRRPASGGCVIATGRFGCAHGTYVDGAAALALSTDERNLYAAVDFGTAIFALTTAH
jgi:hypothetical protein